MDIVREARKLAVREIEAKAKISDLEKIKTQLSDLGCVFSIPVEQKDHIYLHHSIEYPDIKKETVVLRIREMGGTSIMTLKKRAGTELDNIEKEIIIDDPEEGREILEHMGFHEVVKVSKNRIEARYKDMTICLDDVDKLGSFIEVEKMTSEENGMKVQDELFAFLETLDIAIEDRIMKGYDTLVYELSNI